jgi:hypothetical protein
VTGVTHSGCRYAVIRASQDSSELDIVAIHRIDGDCTIVVSSVLAGSPMSYGAPYRIYGGSVVGMVRTSSEARALYTRVAEEDMRAEGRLS